MELKDLRIIGAGIMGSQVAVVAARSGYTVLLRDVDAEALARCKARIEKSLNKLASKEAITLDERDEALARIRYTLDLAEATAGATFVVESIPEYIDVKQELFAALEPLVSPTCVLASNTSALPITEIASLTTRPERVIGVHFMNPVVLMRGVEVIRGLRTNDATYQAALALVHSLGKEPVDAADTAGFIVSRLINVLMNEAVRMVEEGNKPEDIDKAMRLCAGHPLGPLELLDLIGLDIVLRGMSTMTRDLGDVYRPRPLLKRHVLAGLNGRKCGQGFYPYK